MEPLENSFDAPQNAPPELAPRWNGLSTRVVSALTLGLIAAFCLWRGGFAFMVFVMLAALVMKKEWDGLIAAASITARAFGYAYVILPCAMLLWLRAVPDTGLSATVALVLMISATDIGAYFVGKRFGRHKLAPTISPGKTWEGLGGGMAACIVTALLLSTSIPVAHGFIGRVLLGVCIAALSQAGDLFESHMKRRAGVKDSGTLLPGHGGLLDRLDGYMFTTPVYAFLIHLALQAPPQ